jgi:thiol-disulfide isomerase/thioredoxin
MQDKGRLKFSLILSVLIGLMVFGLPSIQAFANTGRPADLNDSSETTVVNSTATSTYQSCGGMFCKEREVETPSPASTDTTVLVASESSAVLPPEKSATNIYFFWGEGCPHCAAAKPFLEDLAERYEPVELRAFEIYYDEGNQALFNALAAELNFEPRYVPTIIIGDQYWEGYNDQYEAQLEAKVQSCLHNGCPDSGIGIIPGLEAAPAAPAEPAQEPALPAAAVPEPAADPAMDETLETVQPDIITLPLIGAIDLSRQSLLVSTLLISFVDGFNPCSIWVLTMLLAITLHSGSRKKIIIVGIVFITVTAFVYALFIAGLFTVFSVMSFAGWIHAVIALVALFFALINIKDYFWYQEGLSFTIDDQKKPGLYKRIRKVMDAGNSTWGLIAATVVLAAGVSLVEFACTAGFPVLWTNLLASQGVTAGTFVLLLLVYMLIYQLDELGIFFVAVFTLRSSKMEEKHGRILKLIGGMLMLTLAVVMLVDPSIMNSLSTSLIVFAIAFAAIIVVLLLHRLVLPAAGIRLGTEFQASRKKKHTRRRA